MTPIVLNQDLPLGENPHLNLSCQPKKEISLQDVFNFRTHESMTVIGHDDNSIVHVSQKKVELRSYSFPEGLHYLESLN